MSTEMFDVITSLLCKLKLASGDVPNIICDDMSCDKFVWCDERFNWGDNLLAIKFVMWSDVCKWFHDCIVCEVVQSYGLYIEMMWNDVQSDVLLSDYKLKC